MSALANKTPLPLATIPLAASSTLTYDKEQGASRMPSLTLLPSGEDMFTMRRHVHIISRCLREQVRECW